MLVYLSSLSCAFSATREQSYYVSLNLNVARNSFSNSHVELEKNVCLCTHIILMIILILMTHLIHFIIQKFK